MSSTPPLPEKQTSNNVPLIKPSIRNSWYFVKQLYHPARQNTPKNRSYTKKKKKKEREVLSLITPTATSFIDVIDSAVSEKDDRHSATKNHPRNSYVRIPMYTEAKRLRHPA